MTITQGRERGKLHSMNSPLWTACLAKGYIDIEFARCLTASDSGSQNRRIWTLVNMRWRTRHATHTHTHTHTDVPTDNMQFLVWPVHRIFARQLPKFGGKDSHHYNSKVFVCVSVMKGRLTIIKDVVICFYFHRPQSKGDNVLGSVRPSICPSQLCRVQ